MEIGLWLVYNLKIFKKPIMKNITAMEKTTIEKTAMKRITTTALLLFLALFTLTTNLMSQEKQGWFVGVSPFSFIGAEIKTSRTTTTAVDTAVAASFEYEATIDSDDSVSGFVNDSGNFFNLAVTNDEAKLSLIRGAIELCKRSDAADATTGRIVDTVPLDPTNTANTGYPDPNTVNYYIGYYGGKLTGSNETTEICDLPASAALPEVPSASASESAKKSLQGALAIQFGYNLEKYRVSLTSFSNKAGANRLTNNVLLADWFLTPGFYAGLGITSAKLETEIGSASQTAPAFNLGYARKIGNLQLEAGYLVLNSSFSIQKQTPTVEVGDPQNLPLGEAETQTLGGDLVNRITAFVSSTTANRRYYSTVTVTRTPVSAATVTTTTTTTTTEKVELPSQQVIYLRLVYRFSGL